jgi:hypothetical protein
MTHLGLNFLQRIAAMDQPTAVEVPQSMQAVFAPEKLIAVLIQPWLIMFIQHGHGEPSRNLRWAEPAIEHVGVVFD